MTGAIALAAAIGLSRIYLRAHCWSDVAGGWGLGVGVFGLLDRDRAGRRVHAPQWAARAGTRPRARSDELRPVLDRDRHRAGRRTGGRVLVGLIAVPAWRCYGRVWEKSRPAFLTLFILGTLLGIGAAIGLAVVWTLRPVRLRRRALRHCQSRHRPAAASRRCACLRALALDEVSEAVEAGAGLPEVARAARPRARRERDRARLGEQRARRGLRVARGRARGDGGRGRRGDGRPARGRLRGRPAALPRPRRGSAAARCCAWSPT